MACSLPQFILLKSIKKDKYLRYRKEDDSNHAFLEFSGDEKEENPEVQYVKFEVQKSETMEGFVHIRTLYNNKYWVRKCGEDESKSWIAAEANEPEEDPSKLSCTLFKPVLVDADVEQEGEFVEHDKPQKIRLVHVDQLGQQGCVALADSDLLALQHGGSEGDVDDVFTAHNAASVVVFPPYTALMNHMGLYGSLTTVNGVTYMEFNTSDIGREGVVLVFHQFTNDNPPYILTQHVPNRWWHLPSNSDVVRVVPSSVGALALTPIKLWGNTIALQVRNQTNRFASSGSVPSLGLENVLGCFATNINLYSIFQVHEPVLSRAISDVVYNLMDSRVYNVTSLEKFREERQNNNYAEQTVTFSLQYTTSETTTWNDGVSITTTISAPISTSVPFVGIGLGVEMSPERNSTVVFGEEQSESRTVVYQQRVTIPARKKVTFLVVATRAQCDVPFTCRVADTLSNGNIANYTKFHGLFTAANEFGFETKILQEDL